MNNLGNGRVGSEPKSVGFAESGIACAIIGTHQEWPGVIRVRQPGGRDATVP
jgi:hypothetical protein